ncbi:MAG TPA: hypothetical protein VHG53_02860 [Candidatus Limnocylindria bacterium]|nr:hypothetical protein [Candidatus Limnocylindria bacterium]
MDVKLSPILVAFVLLLGACGEPETTLPVSSSRPARPVAGKQLYLGTSSGAGLRAIDPRTLEDLPGPPLLAVADSRSSSFVVSADGATGAVMDYSYERGYGPSPSGVLVRVFDLRTGAQKAQFNPPRAVIVDALSPDGTKLFARDWPPAQLTAGRAILDSAMGHELETLPALAVGGLTTLRIDYSTLRAYGLAVADASGKATGPQSAAFVALDLRTGRELRRLPLDGLVAGVWETEIGGERRQSELGPGLALSPDGTRVAILHADGDWLTLIDTASLAALWTKRLSRPVSLRKLIGLGPLIAEAKTNYESRSWVLSFSPDGNRLFAMEQTVQLEGEAAARYATPRLRSIDIAKAQIQSELVPADRVSWATPSPDGSALYVMLQRPPPTASNGYLLLRLDAATLTATEIARSLDDYRELRILALPR